MKKISAAIAVAVGTTFLLASPAPAQAWTGDGCHISGGTVYSTQIEARARVTVTCTPTVTHVRQRTTMQVFARGSVDKKKRWRNFGVSESAHGWSRAGLGAQSTTYPDAYLKEGCADYRAITYVQAWSTKSGMNQTWLTTKPGTICH